MPSDLGVRLLIEAENNATPELEKLRVATDKVTRGVGESSNQIREATHLFRLFGAEIATQVNPALGAMTFAVGGAGRAITGLSPILSLSITALAVATAGFAQYIKVTTEATSRMIDLQTAVGRMDFSNVRSQVDAAIKELQRFDESLLGKITGYLKRPGGPPGVGSALESFFGKKGLQQFIQEGGQAFQQTLPPEVQRQALEATQKQIAAMLQLKQIEASRYEDRDQLDEYVKAQQQIAQQLDAQYATEVKLAQNRADLARSAAMNRPVTGALPGELDLINQGLAGEMTAAGARYRAGSFAASEVARRGVLAMRGRISTPGAFGEPDLSQIPRIYGNEQDYALEQRRLAMIPESQWGNPDFTQIPQITGREQDAPLAQAALKAERDRLTTLRDVYGLSQQEVAQRTLAVIEAEKQLKLSTESLSIEQDRAIQLDAEAKSAAVLRIEFERTNALGGLAKGFKDAAEAAESSGRIMQDFARNTATTMQQSFSDLFFNVVTGQFKNMADVGKQFGLAMARNFTDALAQSATAPILRGLAGLTGGVQNYFFPNSGMGLLNIAPAGQAQTASLQRAGYSVGSGGGVGGGGYATGGASVGSSLYGNLYGGDTSQFGTGTQTLAGAGGFDVGSLGGLGVGLAGVGLGVLASQYTGMQAGAFGAASIGLTAGAGLATLFGAGLGASAGIGSLAAIVAIGAYIAIAGATAPTNDRPNTGWRLIELSKALDADGARVNASRSFLELADAIRGAMHQAYGGDRTGYSSRQTTSFTRGQGGTSAAYAQGRGASMASAGYAIWINGQQVILPGGSYAATMTLADFAVYLETKTDSFTARLQLGLDERTLRDINSNFEQVVKDQAERIRTFNTLPISFSETAPGLQRTTILAAGALENTAGIRGQALSVDRQLGLRLGLTDDQIDSFLRRLSDRNTQTDRFPDLPRDVRLIL